MGDKKFKAIFFAIMAALYAISAPVSKLLLKEIPPTLMASFLYLGAGVGMFIVDKIKQSKYIEKTEERLTKQELPYVISMVGLDIAAPIFLMLGLTITSAANVSLLNNFEIVATSIIALGIFRESIDRRLWCAHHLLG